jgi:hypothetical protein
MNALLIEQQRDEVRGLSLAVDPEQLTANLVAARLG